MSLPADSKLKQSFEQAASASELEKQKAMRCLRSLGMDPEEGDIVQAYLAARMHKGRVYATDVQKVRDVVKDIREDYILKKVYIISRSKAPDLDRQINCHWFIPIGSLERFPKNMNKGDAWVIDSGIDRSDEKSHIAIPGVLEWHTKVGQLTETPQPSMMALEDAPKKPAALPAPGAEPPAAGPAQASGGHAGAAKLLKRNDSESSETDTMENVAMQAKEAADMQRYVHWDKARTDYLEFWCSWFLRQLRQCKQRAPEKDKMPEHMQLFMNFQIETLLNGKCFKDLPSFLPLLEEERTLYPSCFPKLGGAVIQLGRSEVTDIEAIVAAELTEKKSRVFYTSALYQDYMEKRLAQQFSDVKTKCAERAEGETLADICALFDHKTSQKATLPQEWLDELLIMKTLLGPMPQNVKLDFVMDGEDRVAVLSSWRPKHELMRLEPFVKKTVVWTALASQDFVQGVQLLQAALPESREKVRGAMAKSIVDVVAKASQAVEKDEAVDSPFSKGLLTDVAEELGVALLGLRNTAPAPKVIDWQAHDELAGCLLRALPSKMRKANLYKPSSLLGTLLQHMTAKEEATPKQEAAVVDAADEAKQATGGVPTVVPPAGTSPPGGDQNLLESMPAEAGVVPEYSQGDVVKVAMKRKKEFDGATAKVLRINAGSVYVRILDGASVDVQRSFQFHNVQKQEEGTAAASAAGEPQSQVGPVAEAGGEESSAAELKKKEQMLHVFGALGSKVADSEED